jgi:hypothetical protein
VAVQVAVIGVSAKRSRLAASIWRQHLALLQTVILLGAFVSAWGLTSHANAQTRSVVIDLATGRHHPGLVRMAMDGDDDDANGVTDAVDALPLGSDELLGLKIRGGSAAHVRVSAGLRLVTSTGTSTATTLSSDPIFLQATAPSREVGDMQLVVEHSGKSVVVPITVLRVSFVDGLGHVIDPSRDSLAISRRITHDASLPREPFAASDDVDNFRVEVEDPSLPDAEYVWLSTDSGSGVHGVLRHVPLAREGGSKVLRSPLLRLVADATDSSAPEVRDRLLIARLRDRVHVGIGGGTQRIGQDVRVSRPGKDGGRNAALRGKLRMHVLRFAAGEAPVVGDGEPEAVNLAREQIEIANEIWAQCAIDFGAPEDAEVEILDPPPPALLAIADVDGMLAAGDGEISFVANGVTIGPVKTRRGASPEATALSVALALRARGFRADISVNPRTEQGSGPSADIVVRDAEGELVTLSAKGVISSDKRQRADIGRVDLSDGIQEFDNMLAATGTLEERSLVKLVGDADATTIDVIVVNRFVNPQRQGEAFIEADGSAMANTLIVDRNAVRFQRQAWVQAHELGHVLLDEAFHPDNVGSDRPWLLMDADARQGRVTGPKRLSDDECSKARRRSGPSAYPALLSPAP